MTLSTPPVYGPAKPTMAFLKQYVSELPYQEFTVRKTGYDREIRVALHPRLVADTEDSAAYCESVVEALQTVTGWFLDMHGKSPAEVQTMGLGE